MTKQNCCFSIPFGRYFYNVLRSWSFLWWPSKWMACCHASIEHSQPGKVEKLALAEVRHVIKGGSSKSLLLAGRSNVDFLLLRFYCSHACSPSWRASYSIPEIARTLTQSHRSFSRLQVASQHEKQIMKGRFLYFWWAFRLSQNWTWHCLAHHHVWWLKFWTQDAGGLRNTIVRKAAHVLQPHRGFIALSLVSVWMLVWALTGSLTPKSGESAMAAGRLVSVAMPKRFCQNHQRINRKVSDTLGVHLARQMTKQNCCFSIPFGRYFYNVLRS